MIAAVQPVQMKLPNLWNLWWMIWIHMMTLTRFGNGHTLGKGLKERQEKAGSNVGKKGVEEQDRKEENRRDRRMKDWIV
jgi:hypothetical protein